MRLSQSFHHTRKEIPKDAVIPSHQLMFRAGMIQQLASGIYNYLPLALRGIRKIERIIREELDKRGCEEVLMPAVLPSELWKESGRWDLYGDLLLRFKDRKNNEYCMGPTHEEAITDMVRRTLRSWKQLPWNLYQIQGKFRDEFRPRFGLMRSREFIMKDAYSFDCDPSGAKESYWKMYEAYSAIFKRCGLKFRAVEAATGEIGGDMSHEFQVLAATGEDKILSCDSCGYAANVEKAVAGWKEPDVLESSSQAVEEVKTPGKKTIEDVSAFLNEPMSLFLKSLLYEADTNLILVLIAGDKDVNETKLMSVLGAERVRLAPEQTVLEKFGTEPGFIGPVADPAGLDGITIVADRSIHSQSEWITGANRKDAHLKNVCLKRDFNVEKVEDLAFAFSGDRCSRCEEGTLEEHRGIEVGQVFYLGNKYSKALKCLFLDKEGTSQPAEMGCYGIGVGRTLAAAVEQNHDENGIIWPVPIAPWEVVILPLQSNDDAVVSKAEEFYQELSEQGIEVVIDDRPERPGFKFKDADLVGYPVQVILGSRSIAEGMAEVKFRASGEKTSVSVDKLIPTLRDWVDENRWGEQ